MNEKFSLVLQDMQKKQAIAEIKKCNELTIKYDLHLNDDEVKALVERRFDALKNTGRIEFSEGILTKIIEAFCDSPYIMQQNYEDTLLELQDAFYFFKSEAMDQISDDELIEFMKRHFDGKCQGSLEYLSGTTLEELCRNTRYGFKVDDTDIYGRQF